VKDPVLKGTNVYFLGQPLVGAPPSPHLLHKAFGGTTLSRKRLFGRGVSRGVAEPLSCSPL